MCMFRLPTYLLGIGSFDMKVQTDIFDFDTADIEKAQYRDGTLALMARYPDGHDVLTINLGDYFDNNLLTNEQFYVKEYSGFEGLAHELERVGYARAIRRVLFGPFDASAILMELL